MTREALSPEMARALGETLLIARPLQVPWKALEERYGLCKARLVQLRNQAVRRLAEAP
jgi:hypothetical protein